MSCASTTSNSDVLHVISNYIKLRIGCVYVFALVDSGADVSVMSSEMLSKINSSNRFKISMGAPLIQTVSVANGETQQVQGRVHCSSAIVPQTGRLRNVYLNVSLHILHHIQPAIILGKDFLTQYSACIDFGRCCLKLQKAQMFAECPFTVPPNSESIVIARVRANVPQGVAGITGQNRVLRSLNLLGSRVLTQTRGNGEVHVRLYNPTEYPITVKQRTSLGHIDWLSSEDKVCALDSSLAAINSLEISTQPAAAQVHTELPAELKDKINLSQCSLTDLEKQDLIYILHEYKDVFATSMDDLTGCTVGIEHEIITDNNAPPVRCRPYRINPTERKTVDQTVQELKQARIITESNSPWASPIVLVRKSDGTLRTTCDFRKLNALTKFSAYSMPPIQECLDSLGQQQPKIFSTFDCFSGYFQIPLAQSSQEKTAFIPYAGGGQYHFLRMPMGVSGGPATFQRVLERALGSLHWTVALTYLDDVILFSRDWTTHSSHLRQLFQAFRNAGLKLKASKCTLAADSVKYLGHVVNQQGVQPNQDKVSAIQSYPAPHEIKSLRTFLGMTGFYRRHILGYSHIAEPLFRLTRKDMSFTWSTSCQTSFQQLKDRLSQAPVLAFPDWTKPFILTCDASGFAVGYILSQENGGVEKPIAYGGRSLNVHERKYSPTEAEACAVISGIRHFDLYLRNSVFTVITDHAALVWLFNIKAPTGRLARWSMFLQQYRCTIKSKPGKSNANADALSRRVYDNNINEPALEEQLDNVIDPFDAIRHISLEQEPTINVVTRKKKQPTVTNDAQPQHIITSLDLPPLISLQHIIEQQRQDSAFSAIIDFLLLHQLPQEEQAARLLMATSANYHIIDNVLYHVWVRAGSGPTDERSVHQLAVPTGLRETVLQYCHTHPTAAHFGIAKTLDKVRFGYFWPKMAQDVANFIRSCETCARRKEPVPKTRAALQPLQATRPFEIVEMDIVGKLPVTSNNNAYLLVLQDWFTKWPIAIPIPDITAKTVATALLEHVILIFGPCTQLHTDLGKQFTSSVMREVCNFFSINKSFSTAYRPQVQGLVERFNGTLVTALSKLCNDHQTDWDVYVPMVLWGYRTVPNASTGYSPFKLLLGREPVTPLDLCLKPQLEGPMLHRAYVAQVVKGLELAHAHATNHIQLAKEKMRAHYNETVFNPLFELGDMVYIYTPLLQKNQTSRKLMLPWTGPFRLVERTSDVHFKVRRCSDNKLLPHKIHINRFKRAYEFSTLQPQPVPADVPPTETSDDITVQDLTPTELHEDENIVPPAEPVQSQSPSPVASSQPQPQETQPANFHQIKKVLFVRDGPKGREYQVRWLNYKTPSWIPESDLAPTTREYLLLNPVPFKRPYRPRC